MKGRDEGGDEIAGSERGHNLLVPRPLSLGVEEDFVGFLNGHKLGLGLVLLLLRVSRQEERTVVKLKII